jgi:AraC-like DNA-binding protein
MVFQLRGNCLHSGGTKVPASGFTGLWSTKREHDHSAGNTLVLVHFTPVGAACCVPAPLDEFCNATTDLVAALATTVELDCLHEKLSTAPGHASRIRLIEQFLLHRTIGTQPDPLILAAVKWLENAPANAHITALTRYIGLSQSALERRFRRVVGVAPRKYASLVRLQRVIQLREKATNLADLAQAAGYCDQSHFIHDFRRFAGTTPTAYFAMTG